MSSGLKTTLKWLTETSNEAAVDLLVAGLDAPQPAIQQGAVRAILGRRSKAGHRQLLYRWHAIRKRWKAVVAERPGRLSAVMRDAILGTDREKCLYGCEAVLDLREYDLLPALINAAEDEANPNADLATATLLRLTELLYDDLIQSRDYRRGRDPRLMRQHCLGSLETSVQRFFKHQRRDILEAFLLLATRDNCTLKRILQNPYDSSYLPLVEILSTSSRPGVMRLVLSFLDDPHAPSAALNLLAHRCDQEFLHHLLAKIGYEPSASARINLKRITSIPWLRGDLRTLDGLNEQQQHATVQLVMASGVNRLEAFEVIRYLLERGNVGGRRGASAALAEFRGAEANQLASERLEDEDPHVQANVLLQLRSRRIAGAMNRLLDAIDSRHEVVRAAARRCLSEFNIHRYLSAFDMLEDGVRQSTGQLVKKVDPQAIPVLVKELKSGSRTRRLRALGAAAAMGAAGPLQDRIIAMLKDSDHFVRAEAAGALAKCDSEASRRALREALADSSVTVQEAAERSLRTLAGISAQPGSAAPDQPLEFPTTVLPDMQLEQAP